MMGEQKLKISKVAELTGLNRNTITLLYKETASRIELDAINGLCKLFNCQVSDLFEWIDDEK